MHSWGVWTLQSDPNLKKIVLIKALQWLLILLFLYFFHFVMATKVFGTQKFSFSLSLSVDVYVTHVWVFLLSKAWFILFSFYHSLWEKWVCCTHCWLSPQHLLPSLLLNSPWFPFGDLGFQGCWFYFHLQILSLFAGKPLIVPLLIQSKKTQSVSTGLQSLMQSSPVTPTSSPTASPPTLYSFTRTPLLFLKYARHFYVSQYAPTFRTLTLCSVRIKQMKTDWVEGFSPNPSFWLREKRTPIQSDSF